MHVMIDNGVMEKEGNRARLPGLDVGMRILVAGSGGRLGRLLHAARTRGACRDAEFIFQSSGPDRDVRWTPDDSLDRLPACDMMIALWGKTAGTSDDLAMNTALVDLSRRVARHCGARRLFHVSTAAVYGPGAKLTEDAPLRPIGPYGEAKLNMERAVTAGDSAVSEHVLRLANVVGADSLAPALAKGGEVTLDQFADGRGPIRSYIGATDLLGVLKRISDTETKPMPRVLNIAAPGPVAMEDLVLAAGRQVLWRPAPDSAIKEVSLDVGCLQALLPDHRFTSDAGEMIADLNRLEIHR